MMNDMSFNSGATPVTPPRPVATSIADKINERFKSARKNSNAGNSDSSVSSSPRKMLSFDVPVSTDQTKNQQQLLTEFEIKNDDIPIVNQAAEGPKEMSDDDVKPPIPLISSVVECPAEDEDEWEDCSDDDSTADVDEQMIITKEEDPIDSRADVDPLAIADPLVVAEPLDVIKTSPKTPSTPTASSQTTSVTPQTKQTTPLPSIVIKKNMLIDETVNRLYMSIKPLSANPNEKPTPIVQSIKPIVLPTKSIGQPSPIVRPAPTIVPPAAAKPRRDMIPSQSVKTINRIDNLGFSVWNNVYAFCCLINNCGYESNRANICTHILEHNQQWTGYCYMCDLQVSFE